MNLVVSASRQRYRCEERLPDQSRGRRSGGMETHGTQQIMLQKEAKAEPAFSQDSSLWISNSISLGVWSRLGLRHFPDCVLLLDPRCRQAETWDSQALTHVL